MGSYIFSEAAWSQVGGYTGLWFSEHMPHLPLFAVWVFWITGKWAVWQEAWASWLPDEDNSWTQFLCLEADVPSKNVKLLAVHML